MEEPRKIKHYELLSRLGEGGMGVVYRARDTRLGRTVALKMLPSELAHDEERSRRFEREARIISSISHPGIATLYDVDRDGETAFLTMELIEGPTLREMLRQGPMPVPQLIDCAVQVAEALAAAHQKGVIHRDLKPENVMAAPSGYYKVLDFGVARLDDAGQDNDSSGTQTPTRTWATRAGSLIGTVAYMSPEQAMGRTVDARSDIFTLGSLVYEMATGEPCFRRNNDVATAHAIAYEEPPSARSRRPDLPDGLEWVIRKCLAKKTEERYPTAEELCADLRALRAGSLSGTGTSFRLHAAPPPGPNRKRWLLAAIAVAAVAAGLALLGPRFLRSPAEDPAAEPSTAPARSRPVVQQGSRPRVIVAFFANNSGDPQMDWLIRGLPEMLTTDLARSDELEVIATQRLDDLLTAAERGRLETQDRSTVTELARWAEADLVISGSVFKSGGQYRIDAQAHDTASGTVRAAHKVEGTDLFQMVGELTAGLRLGLSLAGPGKGNLQMVSTSSEKAYQLFMRGKELYDNLSFPEAAEQFRRAAEADPEFAEAQLRRAMSLHLAGDPEKARESIGESMVRIERMPEAERLLARGIHAYFEDDDPEAGDGYLADLLRKFPREREAYVWWAKALSERASDPLGAAQKLRLAIEQDPGNLQAVAALADQLARFGQTDDARGLLREALRSHPDAETAITRIIDSYAVEGDP